MFFDLLAFGTNKRPGFNTHSSAFGMCRTYLQLGRRQNLPQAQIPVQKNKTDGKVIIIISMVNILIDLYTYQIFPYRLLLWLGGN